VLPAASNVGQPISHRLDHLLSGVRAQIALKVYGDDLDTLRGLAADLRERLATIPGLTDLQVEKQVLIPQIKIHVDYEQAARHGVAPGALLRFAGADDRGRAHHPDRRGQPPLRSRRAPARGGRDCARWKACSSRRPAAMCPCRGWRASRTATGRTRSAARTRAAASSSPPTPTAATCPEGDRRHPRRLLAATPLPRATSPRWKASSRPRSRPPA
jgi:hypothetical protein